MGWVHEDPHVDLYDHEGYSAPVLADGVEPDTVGEGWWVYNGHGGRPLATAVRAACSCGWRATETHPIDWDDHEATEGDMEGTGPYQDWDEQHLAELLTSTKPAGLVEALATVRQHLDELLVDDRPLAALSAAAQMERIAAHVIPQAATAARRGGLTWDAIGRALDTTRQAAHQRLAKHTLRVDR